MSSSSSLISRPRGGNRDRGVRIDQQARCAGRFRRSCRASSCRRPAVPRTSAARAATPARRPATLRCPRNARRSAATAAPLRPFSSNSSRSKLLATWMSMLGLRLGRDRPDRHLAACHIPRQDVVGVGADHQPLDRQADRAGEMAGIDIAEIAGRHAERHRPARRAERQPGGDVIDDLRRDPREIDRIDRRQVRAPAASRASANSAFTMILAIVECALDRQRVRIRRLRPSSSAGAAPRRCGRAGTA